jgi:proline iminopeptidase
MQGLIEVLGHKIFYESFGDQGERGTVLILHGGPGVPHGYLLPLQDLTRFGYRVAFYDQLGCGKSDRAPDDSLFTVEHYVDEVEGVRQVLGGGKVHLLGQSWGGMLAIAYALKHQSNLKSLIIASGLASVPLVVSEMNRLRTELPLEVQETMRKYEALGEFKNPEYLTAGVEFYKRHTNRIREWKLEDIAGSEAGRQYFVMWGPNEFVCTGTLRKWDVTDQLHTITVPTLITCGRYDEVTPKVAQEIHSSIKGSRLVEFEKSSHQPMSEEREKYMGVVGNFLLDVDGHKP